MRISLRQISVPPKIVTVLLLLLLSSGAYAGPSVVTCSCDVDDQIDAQGPLRGDATGEAWVWANNETVILQNQDRWRKYRFRAFGALFIKMAQHGEGQYSEPNGGGDDDDTNCENGAGNEGEEECDESPILLDLDRNGFHLSGGPATFDIDSDGQLESVTWVSPNTRDGFLYLDRNGNGIVDSGLELFGNRTLLANGEFARHGYQALREFDRRRNGGNRDRVIDSSDSIFTDLRVWIDDDANGICEVHETLSVAEAGVLSLNLNFRRSRRTDSHGNEFRYISRGRIEVNGKSKRMKTTDVFFRILAQ